MLELTFFYNHHLGIEYVDLNLKLTCWCDMQSLWFGVQKNLRFFYLQSDTEIHSYIPYRFCLSKRKQFYSACLPPFSWLAGWLNCSFLPSSISLSFCSPITTNEGLPVATLRFLHFSLLFGTSLLFTIYFYMRERLKILFYLHIIYVLSSRKYPRENLIIDITSSPIYNITIATATTTINGKMQSCEITVFVNYYASFNISQILQSQLTFFFLSNLLQRFVRNFTIFSP